MNDESYGIQSYRAGFKAYFFNFLSLTAIIFIFWWWEHNSWSFFFLLVISIVIFANSWYELSKLALEIELAHQELKFISHLPLMPNVLFFKNKKEDNFISVRWDEIKKIDYDCSGYFKRYECLSVFYGDKYLFYIDSPSTYFPLKKLLSSLRLHVNLEKFNDAAREIISEKFD